MRNRLRPIGFAAAACAGRFLVPTRARCHSAVPPERFTAPNSTVLSATPLQSSFASHAGPSAPEGTSEPTCLDFTPSSRLHAPASTHVRGFPNPRIRSALRFSQPLGGFLRIRACGLISSRCHVQDRPVQGLLLPRSHPSSSEGAYPHAVAPGTLIAEAMSARQALGFEVLIRVRVRCIRAAIIHRRPARFPLQVFLLQVTLLSSCTRFTQVLRS